MSKFNGHKNWTHWNVALWLANDEGLYRAALDHINETKNLDAAADALFYTLTDNQWGIGMTCTPDGAKFSKTNIRAALAGLK